MLLNFLLAAPCKGGGSLQEGSVIWWVRVEFLETHSLGKLLIALLISFLICKIGIEIVPAS